MRILYIANTSWRGDSVALYNLIKGLYKKHEISVLFPKGERLFCEKLKHMNIDYYTIPYGLNIYPQKTFFLLWIYRYLSNFLKNAIAPFYVKQIIKQIKPDIVHCNVGPLDISFDVCKKMKIPHIWHQREYQDLDFNMTFIPCKQYYQNKILSKGNYNIAITKGVFKHWNLRNNIDKIIYDGVFDKERIPKYEPMKMKENYFLFVGRVEEAKGTLDAIKGFKLFNEKYSNYKLLIAGQYSHDSNYVQLCYEYIKKNRIEDKVTFIGERKDVYLLMSKAQALLVTSRFEGFGFITTEAMICGCLVIGRNTGGTKEQLDNGLEKYGSEIGLRFSSTSEIPVLMEKVITNNFEIIRYNAYCMAKNNYSLQKHAKEIEDYYNTIIKKNNN